MLNQSIFANHRQYWRRASIFIGFAVCLISLALTFMSWWLATRSEQDSVSTLKSFVDNAILVSQKDGTLSTEDTILRLGQISRPRKVEFFLFNGDHELLYSSRVEMNVGGNFSNWLITPRASLARFMQTIPPGSSRHFSAVLQPIRGWKPKPGDAYISYIPGSAFYMLASLEGASGQDIAAAAMRDLSWSAGLSIFLGFLTGFFTWVGASRHINNQEALWDSSTVRAVNAINLAVKSRSKIQKNDVLCTEMQNFLSRLHPAEVYLATMAQTEALMASAEASARALLNSTNEIIFVVDQADEILWTNRRSEEFMEAPRSTLIGSPLPLYAGEPGLELTLKSGLAAAREGSGGSFLWSCRKINTGQVVPVEVWANKISTHGTDAICVSLRDISAQRKTEAELKRMVQDLQTALERGEVSVRSQGVFLARMSHEIRAPINAVIGLCQLGQTEPNETDNQLTLQRIESSARDLLRVVDDVLDMAKMEAGKISLFKQPFDLKQLLHEVQRFCKVRASGRPLHFEVSTSPDLPDFLFGDAGRIKQILINFCENAIKFTQAGVISIQATASKTEPRMVQFRVIDAGIGIPASKQHQLFQDFSQADPTIGRQYGGSGLGLSICKMLVDAMSGKIGLISEEGRGSTFWFEIPMEAASPPESNETGLDQKTLLPPELKNREVLLADDDDINRAVMTRVLESAGCVVEACADGAEAFEKVLAKDFDFAILDLEMPVMDGFRTLESIRKLPGSKGSLPILAISSHLREQMISRVSAAGFSSYVTKPIDPAHLYPLLVEMITSKKTSLIPEADPELPLAVRHAVFDAESGRKRLGGELTLYDAMTARFLERWCLDASRLESLLLVGDAEAIRLAHTLRGAAATIGAHEVAELAATIESNLRAETIPEQAIRSLPSSLHRVEEAIVNQRNAVPS